MERDKSKRFLLFNFKTIENKNFLTYIIYKIHQQVNKKDKFFQKNIYLLKSPVYVNVINFYRHKFLNFFLLPIIFELTT